MKPVRRFYTLIFLLAILPSATLLMFYLVPFHWPIRDLKTALSYFSCLSGDMSEFVRLWGVQGAEDFSIKYGNIYFASCVSSLILTSNFFIRLFLHFRNNFGGSLVGSIGKRMVSSIFFGGIWLYLVRKNVFVPLDFGSQLEMSKSKISFAYYSTLTMGFAIQNVAFAFMLLIISTEIRQRQLKRNGRCGGLEE